MHSSEFQVPDFNLKGIVIINLWPWATLHKKKTQIIKTYNRFSRNDLIRNTGSRAVTCAAFKSIEGMAEARTTRPGVKRLRDMLPPPSDTMLEFNEFEGDIGVWAGRNNKNQVVLLRQRSMAVHT